MTDKIRVYDDGSVASKLLRQEYKDADIIKGGPDLVEAFTKVDSKDRSKIYLPFTVQDLVENNEEKRREIAKVEALGFRNLIVLPFEGQDRKTIEFQARNAGIKDEFKVKDQVSSGVEVSDDGRNKKTAVRTTEKV
jgi:hypothetical protein